jgi:DNA-directed RNA polymerase specialized sigma54-like protein
MSAGLQLSQRLSQQMVLSPQLQHSLALLQAPVLELKAMVEQELQLNPVLEEIGSLEIDVEAREAKAEAEAAAADPAEPPLDVQFDPALEKHDDEPVDRFSEDLQKLLKLDEEWREVFAQNNTVNKVTQEDEERRQHLFDSLTTGQSLQEYLLEQVRFTELTPEQREVSELLIGNIDDRGYLTAQPEELTFSTGFSTERILEVLSVLQSFEPPGVGARDLRECLMLQMERAGRTNDLEYLILRDYMEELGKRRFPEIARQLGITPSEAQEAAGRIARLDPRPGSDFSRDPEQYVVPELEVIRRVVDDPSPDIKATDIEDPPSLAEILSDPDEDDEVITHLRYRLSMQTREGLRQWRFTGDLAAEHRLLAAIEGRSRWLASGGKIVPESLLSGIAEDLTRIVRGDERLYHRFLGKASFSSAADKRLKACAEQLSSEEMKVGGGATEVLVADLNRIFLCDFLPITETRQKVEYEVAGKDEFMPQLRISSTYKDLLAQAETSAEVREYVRDKIKAGKFLIKSLNQRQSTILSIGREIVKRQRDFMEKGVEHLKPMTMVMVAEVVGVHETTVSRAVSGKFMRTPQGIFEMKFFFTSGVATADGQTVSNTSVKNILAELIAGENPAKPLSDDQLVNKLKEKNVMIARRTVAKYRAELNVLPSHLRRTYQ